MDSKTEIYLDKGRALFMGAYLIVILLILNYLMFLTPYFSDKQGFQFLVIALDVFFGYNLFKLLLRTLQNAPVIVLTKEGITTNYRGNVVFHPWADITHLHVQLTGRFRHLLVESPKGKSKVDITGLTVKPEDIAGRISAYRPLQESKS